MIISEAQVSEIAGQLKQAIITREEKYKQTLHHLSPIEQLSKLVNTLVHAIKKVKVELENEGKHITEMKSKLQEITKIKEINTDDPDSEKYILSYVETQSIISNESSIKSSPISAEMLLEPVNSSIEAIHKFMKEKNLKRDKGIDPLEFPIPLPIDNKPQQPENKYILETKPISKPKANSIPAPSSNAIYIYRENVPLAINTLKLDTMPVKEAGHLLALENKKCMACLTVSSNILILKCSCMICPNCLKERMKKRYEKILCNTFEAEKKQEALGACPFHGTIIWNSALEKLFGAAMLEQMSLQALRRQMKSPHYYKFKTPTLCSDCKIAVNDDYYAITVCPRHKICKSCYEYF